MLTPRLTLWIVRTIHWCETCWGSKLYEWMKGKERETIYTQELYYFLEYHLKPKSTIGVLEIFFQTFFWVFLRGIFKLWLKEINGWELARLSLLINIVFRCVLASLYEGVQEGTGSGGERDYSLELCVRRHYVSDGKIDTFLYNYTCFCLLDTERDKNMFRL